MQEDGITRPSPTVVQATRKLVERLATLSPDEQIEIEYTNPPLYVRYIRHSTGEILAEIRQHDAA
ncbi:hypothetical protein TSA66_24655 [Noviherbaspirillum autotrophicum]|uniref:Uncharacterized protein n=1 Tax=Noviherbaspirillum autotrophicum TaxID=709839 RepID=A0A0C2BZ56_9BURK|nr:hypothetical protein TSA66_24655 [Noviherbaspirillum autotrophicum]